MKISDSYKKTLCITSCNDLLFLFVYISSRDVIIQRRALMLSLFDQLPAVVINPSRVCAERSTMSSTSLEMNIAKEWLLFVHFPTEANNQLRFTEVQFTAGIKKRIAKSSDTSFIETMPVDDSSVLIET